MVLSNGQAAQLSVRSDNDVSTVSSVAAVRTRRASWNANRGLLLATRRQLLKHARLELLQNFVVGALFPRIRLEPIVLQNFLRCKSRVWVHIQNAFE